ncbi:ribonuclease H-like domain-containing protein [Tanacetum coccineum]
MTGNKCYLTEYEDYDGGFVSFGDGKGRISGKGKIKTRTLDFENVYFCKDLKYNLFSVSQICDKKNNVLFTDTECLVLSSDFKLLDESQVLLRVPRKDNIYSVDLKSVGIKRKFSVARTPQQNGVAERRNRTLIEAARTMVLVIKPHTKTTYELIRRRTPLIDFMKPFGCHVTILNTRDHRGKFDGKADEGFFVGYSMTVHKVPNTKDTIRFKLDTQKITYTLDMFRATLKLPVEIPDNPFVAPVTIEIIESFMNKVGYQRVVDKCVYYWECVVRGMLIPDEFLTEEIRSTDDFKKYETVFVRVDVPMNQSQPVVSTQGTRMSTPRTHRTPTVSTASPQGKKRKPTAGESSSPLKLLKIIIRQKQVIEGEKDDDDFEDRLEPRNHKENPEHVDDDDDKEKTHKKVDRVLHEIIPQLAERATDDLIENNLKPSIAATIIEDRDAFRSEVPDLMKRSLQDQANDPVLWEVLKRKFEKSSTSNSSCRDDDIHSQRHDDHQEDDAPPEGEKK